MSQDLTEYAIAGFDAQPGSRCPHYATSDAAAAWHIGHWVDERPRGVRASRGYTYHVNGFKVAVVWAGGEVKIRRI